MYTAARCSVVYPAPSDVIERHVTMATFICQYVVPMLVTSVAYGRIACRLWWRGRDVDRLAGGGGLLPTDRQRVSHDRARRRSIALLASVVIIFTISWLPLNLYHVLTDFHPDTATFHYNRSTNPHHSKRGSSLPLNKSVSTLLIIPICRLSFVRPDLYVRSAYINTKSVIKLASFKRYNVLSC